MPSQRTTGYVTAVLPEPFVVFVAWANADVRFDVSGADDLEQGDGCGRDQLRAMVDQLFAVQTTLLSVGPKNENYLIEIS
jgi:hypothetical protein